ncbi:MAG: EAL domain-containing protein [Lachnospiraceae bacterium]|nr:EAL domain-containing protein [Lachnospiraceae bacterium]
MKAYNHLYTSLAFFEEYLDSIQLDKDGKSLVRIHSSIHTAEEMQKLAEDIKRLLPNAVIIGCSTSKVICEGDVVSDACLVSITEVENSELRLGMFSCKDSSGADRPGESLCREVADALLKDGEGLMLVFFPVSYYRTAKFVWHMNNRYPALKMIGGVAYVEAGVQETEGRAYVLAGTQVSSTDMAAVVISGSALSVYENAICGVESIGRNYEVTKVHEHYLDEMEGEDAAGWYENLLGVEELKKDPLLAGIFPLVREDFSQIAYNLIYEPYEILPEPWKSEKRSRLNFFTELAPGMKLSLSYFDPQKIVSQLGEVYKDLREKPVETLFAYECLSRTWILHDCAKWEVSQFFTTNMSGAMLSGEVINIGGKNTYANSTFVVAGLSENPDARLVLKSKSLRNTSALQHNNVQMINYLLKMGNKQLNKQLSDQQEKMKQAMFYCSELGLDNQTQYLFDCESINLDKIAIFTLKNERIMRLFMGNSMFMDELKGLYEDVGKRFFGKKLHFYSYGDCSLLIAAESHMGDEAFISCMKEVFDYLNGVSYKDFVFSYQGAVVLREREPLQKAEAALQYGIKNKISFVLYSEMPGEVLSVKEEMHMLQTLREALVQDRVVPYFQAIHDNRTGKVGMYEALLRIQDAQGNIYQPGRCLPVAKDYNLYESMSIIMIKKVMEMFLDKDIAVTVNLNVQDIYDRDMLRMIFHYLKEAKHPENFIFELVESEEIRDYQFIKQFADSVHEYGARIAIDDFGSGFSNMLHIIRIDADILKIDGEIIKEICCDKNCREFVELINDWCTRQGKEVVGEYVENEAIQKVMEEIGIAYSQGFYFARPQPWKEEI